MLEFNAPANVDYSFRGKPMKELLLSGVVDAALGEVGVEAPEIKPLIPDARNAAFDYFRKTGIYPINHGIVIKNSVLKDKPWIADELMRAFEAAKAEYLKDLKARRDRRRGTRPRPSTPRWSATRSRSASRTTARRWRRSRNSRLDQKMVPRKYYGRRAVRRR